jgi:hypothetical protein
MRNKIRSQRGRSVDYKFLPYGCGYTPDGASVVFSRDYEPLIVVRGDRVTVHDGSRIEYVPVCWYYTDTCPPDRDAYSNKRIGALMERIPRLLEAVEKRRNII